MRPIVPFRPGGGLNPLRMWVGRPGGASRRSGVAAFIAGYVALCLAFAGAVGANPDLHRWIEHGGEGASHTHPAMGSGWVRHARAAFPQDSGRPGHSHAGAHAHGNTGVPHAHDAAGAPAFPDWMRPAGALTLAGHPDGAFSLLRVWAKLRAWLKPGDEPRGTEPVDGPAGPTTPPHQHDSLPQSLVGGSVEVFPQHDQALLVAFPAVEPPKESPSFDHAPSWYPQTAGRAPPG